MKATSKVSTTTARTDDLKARYQTQLSPLWRSSPFALRFTEWKDIQGTVLVIKERLESDEDSAINSTQRSRLVERGHISGESQRRCVPIMRIIVEKVNDSSGIPLDLQRFLTQEGLRLRINLPLDEEAGAKLALLFRLQERLNDLDRVELIARRIARFSREEAAYWLSRTTSFGPDANRWAISGLRLMLGGQPNDKGVTRMLERLRAG